MVRCPTCGIRLHETTRKCPRHGTAPASLPPADSVTVPIPTPALPGYRIGRLLGRGGFGAVFAADRLGDGAPVAIKIAGGVEPRIANVRLAVEGNALAAIGPPTVPALFDRGELADGAGYLIIEYVRSPTLAEFLVDHLGPLPADLITPLAPAIVRLVERVHAAGFMHGDLKPENLFVGPFGLEGAIGARLFDFGLARPLDHGSAETGDHREALQGAGTPEYMSPEQCAGQAALNQRSDIYSLGVLLYEMCAGTPPFWGNPAEILQSHIARRPPRLPRPAVVAPGVEDLILRSLAKDPERRFSSAADLAAELEAALRPERSSRGPAPAAEGPDTGVLPDAAPDAPADGASARPAGSTRSRSPVAIVFFEIAAGAGNLTSVLRSLGGQLAHVAGDQRAIVFGREAGDNPARTASQAAQILIERGFCRRALVDLAMVAVQPRPDGTRRHQSAVFKREQQYPRQADPPGVLLSPVVAEMLPDLTGDAVSGDRASFQLKKTSAEGEATSTRAQFAPLVGRDEVLQELIDGARWATTAVEPTIATLTGDPGVGKSHLAAELAQRLQSMTPRMDVIVVRAHEVLGRLGEETTQEILRHLLGPIDASSVSPEDLGRAMLAERIGASAARELWAGVAVAMGWASPDHAEIRGIAAAPGALRSATARAVGELLRSRSRRTPLAFILDDAHLADDTALDSLEFAALREAGCRLWICALARPALAARRPAWGARAARRQEVRLGALDAAAAAELARRLLLPMTNVPATVLAKLTARTEGVPLLMIELVRGLKRDGLLRRSKKTNLWFLATEALENLPALPLVEWLASAETESLAPDLAGHARLASVLGSDFAADDLEGVMHMLERQGVPLESPLDANVGIDRLTTSGLLVRHRHRRVGFRHVLLRDWIYRTLAPERRQHIHRAAYEYYRSATGMRDEDRLARVALHACQSGLHGQSATIYLDLARRAERRHHYLDAEIFYGNAVDNLADRPDPSRIEAAQGRGLMRFRLGRLEDGLKDLTDACARARAAGDSGKELELLLDESMVLDWTNDFGRSAEVTERADSLYGDGTGAAAHSALLDARMAYAKGRALHRREQEVEAAPLFERSVKLAADLGPEGYETLMQASNLLGWAYAMTGRYDDAERTFSRNVALCESAGDMFNLTVVLQNRGILSVLTKRLERVLVDYGRMIGIARENGFGLAEMVAQKDVGEVYLMAGKLAQAEQEARRAIEVSRAVVGARSRGTLSAELLLARLLVFRDRLAEAGALSREIRGRQAEARAEGLTECDFGPGEALMHQMVDLACDAGEPAREQAQDQTQDQSRDLAWSRLLDDVAKITQQPQDTVEMLEVWGLTALRSGRPSEALRRLRQAVELSEHSADVVTPRVRASLALAETRARAS